MLGEQSTIEVILVSIFVFSPQVFWFATKFKEDGKGTGLAEMLISTISVLVCLFILEVVLQCYYGLTYQLPRTATLPGLVLIWCSWWVSAIWPGRLSRFLD
jgi:hypothetical protein